MEYNCKVLLTTPALLFFLLSCSTPLPVREGTGDYWNNAIAVIQHRKMQDEANHLRSDLLKMHSELGPALSESFKHGMLTSLQELQQALDAGNLEEANRSRTLLEDQRRLLGYYQ